MSSARASSKRALLARQLLLRREARLVAEVVALPLGLQPQAPMPPYYGLWSRLEASTRTSWAGCWPTATSCG